MDTCPRCGAVTATDTAFCTACGAVIHPNLSSSESEATLTQPPSSPRSEMPAPLTKWLGAPDASSGDIAPGQFVPDAAHTTPRKWRDQKAPWEMTVSSGVAIAPAKRFTVRKLLAATVVLVATAVVTVLAVAWRSEAGAHHAADAKAALLATQLTATRTSLARTRTSLAQVKSIAQQRRAVLVQAGETLGKVDPLLTRVDAVKSAAARDAQAYSAWANSLAVAYNYLNDSSYLSLDVAYLNLLISDANSRLTKADAADVVYARAVKAFGNTADSFPWAASTRNTFPRTNGGWPVRR